MGSFLPMTGQHFTYFGLIARAGLDGSLNRFALRQVEEDLLEGCRFDRLDHMNV
jgi:hypothetical protein